MECVLRSFAEIRILSKILLFLWNNKMNPLTKKILARIEVVANRNENKLEVSLTNSSSKDIEIAIKELTNLNIHCILKYTPKARNIIGTLFMNIENLLYVY